MFYFIYLYVYTHVCNFSVCNPVMWRLYFWFESWFSSTYAVANLSANDSTAFIWKLCCHWLKGLQLCHVTVDISSWMSWRTRMSNCEVWMTIRTVCDVSNSSCMTRLRRTSVPSVNSSHMSATSNWMHSSEWMNFRLRWEWGLFG